MAKALDLNVLFSEISSLIFFRLKEPVISQLSSLMIGCPKQTQSQVIRVLALEAYVEAAHDGFGVVSLEEETGVALQHFGWLFHEPAVSFI